MTTKADARPDPPTAPGQTARLIEAIDKYLVSEAPQSDADDLLVDALAELAALQKERQASTPPPAAPLPVETARLVSCETTKGSEAVCIRGTKGCEIEHPTPEPILWCQQIALNARSKGVENEALAVAAERCAAALTAQARRLARVEAENARLSGLLNTPEVQDFAKAVVLEAAHQRERWGDAHDTGKTRADWFWVIGYLAGKALHAPIGKDAALTPVEQHEKRLHRIVTVAAAAANWHRLELDAALRGEEPRG